MKKLTIVIMIDCINNGGLDEATLEKMTHAEMLEQLGVDWDPIGPRQFDIITFHETQDVARLSILGNNAPNMEIYIHDQAPSLRGKDVVFVGWAAINQEGKLEITSVSDLLNTNIDKYLRCTFSSHIGGDEMGITFKVFEYKRPETLEYAGPFFEYSTNGKKITLSRNELRLFTKLSDTYTKTIWAADQQ